MKFDAYARQQAQIVLDAIANQVAEATKTELDALRSGVDARIAALLQTVSSPEHGHLLERLVKDLSESARTEAETARGQAEAVASQARLDAQRSADAALATVRAELQAQITAAHTTNAALSSALEDARQQLKSSQAAAQIEGDRTRAAVQAELGRTRAELEGRLDQVQAARAELARVLADAQADAASARAELAAQSAGLEDAQARVHALEHEGTGMLLARDEAATRLDAEARRASEAAEALATIRQEAGLAKQEASLAKVDAEGRRQGLEAATERIRVLEEELRAKTELHGHARAGQALEQTDHADEEETSVALLEHVGTALESIDVAISASEILETLMEQLGRQFAKAAVFLVGPSSFRGWRGSGLGPATDISNIEIPRTRDSLLTRTLADRKPVTVGGNPGDQAVGVLGGPVASALALPVLANGRVIAIAYAEQTEETSAAALTVGRKIAEILIDHANRRLTVKRRPSSQPSSPRAPEVDRLSAGTRLDMPPAPHSPARQARRFAMPSGLQVTLEGSASVLVDLSPLGAQVVSPVAMRPKRVVRMTLPSDNGGIVCKGRVVWAQFEQSNGSAEARYRAGVKFTEVDTRAIDAFLAHHGMSDAADSGLNAKLESTA